MNVRLTTRIMFFAIEHVLSEDLALEMKQKLIEQIGECEILVRELPAVVEPIWVLWYYYQYIRKHRRVIRRKMTQRVDTIETVVDVFII